MFVYLFNEKFNQQFVQNHFFVFTGPRVFTFWSTVAVCTYKFSILK